MPPSYTSTPGTTTLHEKDDTPPRAGTWRADTAWAPAIVDLDSNTRWLTFLDNRAAKGFNVVLLSIAPTGNDAATGNTVLFDDASAGTPCREVRLKFGAAGDLPLFGDVDGDGREEPCVRRGRYHLCDTAHNGGRPEAAFRIGEDGDEPLLGDLDGDGRDDACVFSRGRFLCDLHRAGRKPVAILFGEAGDSPALGDYDGDGDDDPCVLRAGQILCDLAHDGGEAEAVLEFGQIGDRLVLGNLDGL
jgi:hypothetical protein